MLTRHARKRAYDESIRNGTNLQFEYRLPDYIPPRRDRYIFWSMIKSLVPSVMKNRNIAVDFRKHINETEGLVPAANTLVLKTLVSILENAVQQKPDILSTFLKRRSLDHFTNCCFNTSLKLMETIFLCCNWERVRERFLYVQIRKTSVEIHFGRREYLLRLDYGRNNIEKTVADLSRILCIFVKARVNAIYVRSYGDPEDSARVRALERRIGDAVAYFNFQPGPYFKPVSEKDSDAEKVSAEHMQFIIMQTQDRRRIADEGLFSERFLLFDRSRENAYFS